ncbi:hypothetical protein D3C72_1969510 [compost metagenome]
MQFHAEVVHQRLVVHHGVRPEARRDRVHHGGADALLQRDGRVDGPFHLLVPLPRRHQDGQLRQPRADRAAVAQVLAHALRALHQLRTAYQRHKGTVQRAARAVDDGLGGGLLLRCELREGNGAEAFCHAEILAKKSRLK